MRLRSRADLHKSIPIIFLNQRQDNLTVMVTILEGRLLSGRFLFTFHLQLRALLETGGGLRYS